ncbi:MAG: DedA family protein [Acidobacteriota bacterium]
MEQSFIDFLTRELAISAYFSFCLALVVTLIKYLIPPLPCDITILILSFLTILKNKPFLPVSFGIVAGGTIGAILAYRMGLKGKELEFFGEKMKSAIDKFEQPFKKSYLFILVFNRFLPGIRPLIFPLAGFYKINFAAVFFSAIVGNILFALFIYFIVSTAGRELAEIKVLYRILGVWIEFLILSFVVFLILFLYRKKFFSVIRKNKDVS